MQMDMMETLQMQFVINDLQNVIENFLGYHGITWRYGLNEDTEFVVWEQDNFTAQLSWAHVGTVKGWGWELSMDNCLDRFDASGDDILGESITIPVGDLIPLVAPFVAPQEVVSDDGALRNDTYKHQQEIGKLMFLEPTEAAW